jgi:dTDP-4-dehydrorhamnose 3,5-epimerase
VVIALEVRRMQVKTTPLADVMLFEPRCFEDARGYFYESYSEGVLEAIGCPHAFVQENVSGSRRGVLRGLHYQLDPRAQGKLVRVMRGRICDAVVDLRRGSATFGRSFVTEISEENRLRLWVPSGFAHGFCVLSDYAEVLYGVTQAYSPAHERTIRWDDTDLAIAWPEPPAGGFVLSEKDRAGVALRDAEINFAA